jgi:hypothetical protein
MVDVMRRTAAPARLSREVIGGMAGSDNATHAVLSAKKTVRMDMSSEIAALVARDNRP